MFRFFRKKRKKREKIIEEKRSFTRGMLHRKEKLHTQQTHLLRLIHYYISKRAQLTTAFLLLFLRDTLRCSHESAFLRRFIRSRYILLRTDSSSWKARNFGKNQAVSCDGQLLEKKNDEFSRRWRRHGGRVNQSVRRSKVRIRGTFTRGGERFSAF